MKLQELSASERILLAEELWDSVAANEELFPITDEQRTLLDERLSSFSVDREAGDSWENVRNRISKI